MEKIKITNNPNSREAIWQEIMRRKDEPLTVNNIVDAIDANREVVRANFRKLKDAGFISVCGKLSSHEVVYKVEKEQRFAPKLKFNNDVDDSPDNLDIMWRTMKMLRQFSIDELYCNSTHIVKFNKKVCERYVRALKNSGHLYDLTPSKRKNKKYSLIKNTGPRAPKLTRLETIIDLNTKEVFVEIPKGAKDAI